jgi:hypothetical protein
MSRLKFALAALAVVSALGMAAPAARAMHVKVENSFGVPTGVVITLTHAEAQKVAKGENLDIPKLPAKFEKPFRELAAKIKAADMGNGVKVTLKVRLAPPGIRSKVEAR